EFSSGLQGESDDRALRTSAVSQTQGAQACPTNQEGDEESGRGTRYLHRSKRTNSCPSKASRSVISGPWSLEWLHDHA
ncbi:hypothetical protein A2U01_0096118, partial [Trifolium medium]|nr:hypothetical protein [Trifolium medium]